MDDQNWPHFSQAELACKFTGSCHMDPIYMSKLEMLRERFGKPMRISSAFRHLDHPAEKSKTAKGKPPGWHSKGRAVDVLVSGTDAWQLVRYATEMGLSVGISQRGPHEHRFVHIDDRPAPQMIWSY